MVGEHKVFSVLALTIFVILFLILLYPISLFFSTPYIFCPVLRSHLDSFPQVQNTTRFVLSTDSEHYHDIDIVSAVNEIDPHQKWPIEVGEQLFVVGYPFGISDTCNLPIWKSATLASEPGIDQDGLPLLYIDTATRKGMSGSPVINHRRRSVSIMERGHIHRFHAEFVGVYSGRIVSNDLLEAQLGKIWRANVIDAIIDGNSFYQEQ